MKPVNRLGAEPRSEEEREIAQLLRELPDPEPTSFQRTRVWQQLKTPVRARRAGRLIAAVSLAAAVVLGAVGTWRFRTPVPIPSPSEARLQLTAGGVAVADRVGSFGPAPQGHEARAGDRYRTDVGGTALLSLGATGAVLLSPSSEIEIDQLSPGTLLRLDSGMLAAHVTKRPANQPFVIQTQRYRVIVVGTVFAVNARADGEVVVSVNQGVVEVRGPSQTWRVTAGTALHSDDGRTTPSELPDSVAAVLEASSDSSRDLKGRFHDLVAVREASAVAPVIPPIAPVPPVAPAPAARRHSPPPAAIAVAPTVVPPPSPPSAPSSYQQAVQLMAGGQNERAAKLLEEGAAPGSANAGMALYELGRLRQQRLNDPVGALDAFRRYRADFPTGPLLPEVEISMLQLALARGDAESALQHSTEFLAGNPDSERADEVRLVRGNLLRERRECRRALDDYRQIQNPVLAEDALYFSAFCQRELGNDEAVQQALHDYLQRYPTGRYAAAAQRALGAAH